MTHAQDQNSIVPCHNKECTLKDFFSLLGRFVDFIFKIGLPLAVLGIGVSGVMLIVGSASEKTHGMAKEAFWASIWGLVIILAAWLIINTILLKLGAKGFTNLLKSSSL